LTVETGLKDTVNSEYRGSVWQLIVHCKVLGGGGAYSVNSWKLRKVDFVRDGKMKNDGRI